MRFVLRKTSSDPEVHRGLDLYGFASRLQWLFSFNEFSFLTMRYILISREVPLPGSQWQGGRMAESEVRCVQEWRACWQCMPRAAQYKVQVLQHTATELLLLMTAKQHQYCQC